MGRLIEVVFRAGFAHEAPQQDLDTAGIHQSRCHDDAGSLDTELQIVGVGDPLAFLLDRLEITPALSADHLTPIDALEEGLHLRRRYARGVAAPDQRTHAGAGDAVDRHVHFLEHLEHADVGAALGAAAGEHQPDARTMGRGRRSGIMPDFALLPRSGQSGQQSQ